MIEAGRREHGGALSLLITLLAIGALAWFALRASGGAQRIVVNNETVTVSCEQQTARLIAKTGGLGPDYQSGYAALPKPCQRLLPAPGALEPSPTRSASSSTTRP